MGTGNAARPFVALAVMLSVAVSSAGALQAVDPVRNAKDVVRQGEVRLEQMRQEITGMVRAGRTREQVIQYYIDKYGSEEPLAEPINKGFNKLAWLLPYVIGGVGVYRRRVAQDIGGTLDEFKSLRDTQTDVGYNGGVVWSHPG